ncbi:ABC transporter ATP-binding protein [Neolewinella lacunae]|uniref:ABC transporter ATP-binding protein n=1 Tax=Neolewinella lacunae TaxID=1517758 RepID=A0A923PPP3_9BACT|nr:ABC transporter ATP-binding protein [Neolewinella lacunae]MBC6995133.1 ABC transporter ATP-binding protein [Neolewinella lacunae]MDN3634083.1 ABC transporter ATP-binding protein [Neolewinella lacunae]
MIEAQALTKAYGGHKAVDNLNLKIAPGELYCLLGANGAGKTTTINCFLGFLPVTSGRVLIDGLDVAEKPLEVKRRLAYLPEVVMLYPTLSGLENLDYFSRLAGFRHRTAQLLEYLERAGLPAADAQRRLGDYSKGMRQKVGIAIALAKEAKCLLLDEPTSGLDPGASNDFSQLLRELTAQGMAILMATHDIFRAKDVATHIGIMRAGRLREQLENRGDFEAKELEALYLQTV